MARRTALSALFLLLAFAPLARADVRPRELADLSALRSACEEAEDAGRRELYLVTIPAGQWRFAAYDDEGLLPIDTRRNLRLFDGHAEVFANGLETMAFVAGEERAQVLASTQQGASLRIGFFLGFDDHGGTLCLVRPAAGVTTVRVDVAYLEMVAPDGRVLAREDTDRLRAWLDDQATELPGEGARARVGAPVLASSGAPAPEPVRAALAAAAQGPLGAQLARCHSDGRARGASREGQVVARLRAEHGRLDGTAEMSTIGDPDEARCVAGALAASRFVSSEALLELRVAVQLAD